MRVDGTKRTILTRRDNADTSPKLSRDGGKIVFVSDPLFLGDHGGYEIYVMKANGSGRIRLTRNRANDWDPAFSPDGRRIVFVSDRDEGAEEIYVMNANGTGVRRLTFRPKHDDVSPDWR